MTKGRLQVGIGLVVLGVLIAVVSGLANVIGLGDPKGLFGWKQVVGLAVGVVLLVAGLVAVVRGGKEGPPPA